MNVKEVIRKARQAAKTPHELVLPDCFEEYLELLEMRGQASPEERLEIEPRLEQSRLALKEAAEKVALSYGVGPSQMVAFFSNPTHAGPSFAEVAAESQHSERKAVAQPATPYKFRKRKNKNLKV